MVTVSIKTILAFLVSQAVLAFVFYNDKVITGLEAILSVSIGIIMTIYFQWLTKKDEDDYER